MSDNIILMPGAARVETEDLRNVARKFGWTVKTAHVLRDAEGTVDSDTAAIFFHRSAIRPDCSWLEALRQIKTIFPGVAPVACHPFYEPIDWPALCAAGAFHAVWLPLKGSEVRKSLGFVSEARRRLLTKHAAQAVTPRKRVRFSPERFSPELRSQPSGPLSEESRPQASRSLGLH
jgi:hypothetical protein